MPGSAAKHVEGSLTRTDVEVHGHLEFAAHVPERIPCRIAEVGQANGIGIAAHNDPAKPHLVRASDFGRTRLDVPPGDKCHREDPLVRSTLDLDHRVVVDRCAGEAEFLVLDLGEILVSEASHVRVDHLRANAELIHQADARLHVIGGNVNILL